MRARVFCLWAVFLWAAAAFAQVSYVTATATLPSYPNGSVTAVYAPPANSSQLSYLHAGFAPAVTGVLDANGHFSLTLADTATTPPAGSQWQFYLCSHLSAGNPSACYTVSLPITCVGNASCSGSTLDISASFSGAPGAGGSVMDLVSAQTVTGPKTFTQPVTAPNIPVIFSPAAYPGWNPGGDSTAALVAMSTDIACQRQSGKLVGPYLAEIPGSITVQVNKFFLPDNGTLQGAAPGASISSAGGTGVAVSADPGASGTVTCPNGQTTSIGGNGVTVQNLNFSGQGANVMGDVAIRMMGNHDAIGPNVTWGGIEFGGAFLQFGAQSGTIVTPNGTGAQAYWWNGGHAPPATCSGNGLDVPGQGQGTGTVQCYEGAIELWGQDDRMVGMGEISTGEKAYSTVPTVAYPYVAVVANASPGADISGALIEDGGVGIINWGQNLKLHANRIEMMLGSAFVNFYPAGHDIIEGNEMNGNCLAQYLHDGVTLNSNCSDINAQAGGANGSVYAANWLGAEGGFGPSYYACGATLNEYDYFDASNQVNGATVRVCGPDGAVSSVPLDTAHWADDISGLNGPINLCDNSGNFAAYTSAATITGIACGVPGEHFSIRANNPVTISTGQITTCATGVPTGTVTWFEIDNGVPGGTGGYALHATQEGCSGLSPNLLSGSGGILYDGASGTTAVSGMRLYTGWYGSAVWLDIPTSGASAIGMGGPGVNPWIGYAAVAGNWFPDAAAGDLAYRNVTGRLLFGTTGTQSSPGNSQLQLSASGFTVGTPETHTSPVTFGNSSTALARYARYSATISPAAVAANTCAAQTFTVTGLAAADILIGVNKPSEQPGLSVAPGHVSGANTATVNFCNVTGAAITPTAGESYQFVAVQ